MTIASDPLTVETRLQWEERTMSDGNGGEQPIFDLMIGRVGLGSVYSFYDEGWCVDMRGFDMNARYSTEAEARAALIAAAMEDLKYVE